MTRLTKDEQYSLMTFFTILRSPLMFGGDLPSNDPFTLSLLTNKEVLKMHSEGTAVKQLFQEDGKLAVTSKNLHSPDIYLALFNISDDENPKSVSIDLSDIDIEGECSVIDMWTGESIGKFSEIFSKDLAAHASGLYLIPQYYQRVLSNNMIVISSK